MELFGSMLIARCRALHRQFGLSFFLQHFSHQYIRTGGRRIQPDRTLQQPLRVVEFLDTGVRIGQFVVGWRVSRIQRQFLLEIADRFRNPRLVQMQLTQKEVRQRKFRIERNRFLGVLFGDGIEFLAQQHARSKQITGGRIRRNIKHAGKSLPRLRVVLGLDVAQSQNVDRIHVGARIPGLNFLQQRNRFAGLPGKIVGESQQLHRLLILRIFRQRLLERFNRLDVIALPVIRRPQFAGQSLQSRLLRRQIRKLRHRFLILPLLQQRSRRGKVRINRRRTGLSHAAGDAR